MELVEVYGSSQPIRLRWSRGVEYEIDEGAMTVRQVWAYGQERGASYYASIINDVDVLPTTANRLIIPGFVNSTTSYAHVTEVSYLDKQVVFEAKINFTNLNITGQG